MNSEQFDKILVSERFRSNPIIPEIVKKLLEEINKTRSSFVFHGEWYGR